MKRTGKGDIHMKIGEVKHTTRPDGNITTFYRSERGMCAYTSFEAKSELQMEAIRAGKR